MAALLRFPAGRLHAFAAAALLLLHGGLVLHQASRQSATYDEPYYATSGYARLTAGEARMNPEHPPAAKLLLGATWLGAGLPDVRGVPGFAGGDHWTFGPHLLYRDPARAPALLLRARAAVAALSVLLGVGVLLVARRAFGPLAGTLALALYALDPLVVANAGLATLDLAAAAALFAAVALSARALEARGRGPTAGWILAAGAATGVALATKGTALLAPAVLALLVLAPWVRRGGPEQGELRRRALAALGVLAVAAAAVELVCQPEGARAVWRALALQREHAAGGHLAFAAGRFAAACWAWYFPFAAAVKTPLPILAAALGGVALVAAGARRAPERAVALLAPPALLLAAALASGICNGLRQLLPAVPFLAAAGGGALAALAGAGGVAAGEARGHRSLLARRLATGAAIAWAAAGLLRVHPHAITYANEAAGGPSRTWTLLADANVDWGQGLPALAELLRDRPVRRLWLDYFGTAFPPAHGLERYRRVLDPSWRASTVLPEPRRDGADPAGRELLAVSATVLSDVYARDRELHGWLRRREPVAWAGNAIALYDLTGDVEAHRALSRMAAAMGDRRSAAEAWARAEELARGER